MLDDTPARGLREVADDDGGELTTVRPSRRCSTLVAAGAICLTALAGCGEVTTRTTLGPSRNVVVAVDGAPSAVFAPIYEGIANGAFARGALSVSTTVPAGSQSTLSALTSGQATFAITSEPALLAARASGAQVVGIGALVATPLESIISLQSHAIAAPTQLIGKTVATDGSPLAAAELDAFLSQGAIPSSRVHVLDAGSDVDTPLTAGEAVASVGGLWDYDVIALQLAHHKPNLIALPAAGVPTFSDLVIVVRLNEAHYDGALLRALLQSVKRAEQAVNADPSAVANLLVRLNPHLSRRFELAALSVDQPASEPPTGEPFGYQNPNSWATFANWMNSESLLSGPTNGGLAITDEFLPGQGE
jgi:putative hydroxymethylpyrimidine transport system substrate-binding protein